MSSRAFGKPFRVDHGDGRAVLAGIRRRAPDLAFLGDGCGDSGTGRVPAWRQVGVTRILSLQERWGELWAVLRPLCPDPASLREALRRAGAPLIIRVS